MPREYEAEKRSPEVYVRLAFATAILDRSGYHAGGTKCSWNSEAALKPVPAHEPRQNGGGGGTTDSVLAEDERMMNDGR